MGRKPRKEQDIMLLFLGAGASKPCGKPDMRELTDIVIKELKKKYMNYSIIDIIKRRVEDFKITTDIEVILSCIDALCNPDKGIRNAGPFATLISDQRSADKLTFGLKKDEYEELSREIRKIIRKRCFFPSDEYVEKLEYIYDNFFNIFRIGMSNPLATYTTNYDLCFERYCRKKKISLYDGFDDRRRFDHEFRGAKGWELYKLHGSSHWVVTEDCKKGEFTKTDTYVEIGQETLDGKMVKDVMIYPTTEKYFSKSPYFELLNRLKCHLKKSTKIGGMDYCTVIGYSFRDIPINNVFIDVFQNKESKHVLYIDKRATKNVNENIPTLKHVIEPFDKSFEHLDGNDFRKFSQNF